MIFFFHTRGQFSEKLPSRKSVDIFKYQFSYMKNATKAKVLIFSDAQWWKRRGCWCELSLENLHPKVSLRVGQQRQRKRSRSSSSSSRKREEEKAAAAAEGREEREKKQKPENLKLSVS